MRWSLGWRVAAGCLLFFAGAAGAQDFPGLTLDKDGTVLRHGKAFRGIGVNYMDAFSRTLENGGDTSYREGFRTLAGLGIPFARVMFEGYYPINWKTYLENKEEYFRRMDGVVKAAEENGVGLIPSLFFAYAFIGDMVGEPRNAWGDPDSKTVAFMRQYVKEVVTRYRDSDAIWAWEFANEFSLDVDLPNAADHRPPVVPHLGSAASRSAADDLTHDMMVSAFREFGKAVREHDKTRPVTHGASLPRPSAEHLRAGEGFKFDTREELLRNLIDFSPDPIDLVSVHVYPFDRERFGEKDVPYEEILRVCMDACRKASKALFVGEFSTADSMTGDPEKTRSDFAAQIAAIEKTGVPLSALWVFDFAHQEGTVNVTLTNDRAYMLKALSEANRRMGASPDTRQKR